MLRRTCNLCLKERPDADFKSSRRRCQPCLRAKWRTKRQARFADPLHRERDLARKAEWYAAHREAKLAYAKTYHAAHRDHRLEQMKARDVRARDARRAAKQQGKNAP